MATRVGSRLKMRERPLDFQKALPLVDTSQREPDEIEAEAAWAAAAPRPAHDPHHSGHTGQGDGMLAGVGIPTPPNFYDPDYHKRFEYSKFVQSSYYIKNHQTYGTGLINYVERYDLLKDDIDWLNEYNAQALAKRPPGPTVTEDEMEKVMDLFEKEAGKITMVGIRAEMMSPEDKIAPIKEFSAVRAIVTAGTLLSNQNMRSKIIESLYDYWMNKRKRLGKALMRQFVEPPPRGDTDPKSAFRLRTEGRRVSRRNPRKDDTSSLVKMYQLKKDFVRILDIVDNVTTREQLKREQALLNIHVFDQKLQQSPWCQKLLRENAPIAAAINYTQSVAPPALSFSGAPPVVIPQNLVSALSPDQLQLLRLIHSTQPPCCYTRAELESDRRKRHQANKIGSGSQVGTKRPNNVISIRRPDRPMMGDKGRDKSDLNKRHRSMGGSANGLPLLEEEAEELDLTDEEDLLSEDENDLKFYAEVEQYVKRMKIQRGLLPAESADSASTIESVPTAVSAAAGAAQAPIVPPSAVAPRLKTEPIGTLASYYVASSVASTASNASSTNTSPQRSPQLSSSSGGKVGFFRGSVGRGNLVWLECAYLPAPAMQHSHHQQQQQQQYAHAQQQYSSSQQQPPTSATPTNFTSSSALAAAANAAAAAAAAAAARNGSMQINVVPPPVSSNSTAAPMEVDSKPVVVNIPTPIKAQ